MVKRLIFLFSFLAGPCLADDFFFQVPPGVSSNISTFRQQMIDYNLNKAYTNLKANEGFFRHTELQIIEFGHHVERELKGEDDPHAVDPLLVKATIVRPYSKPYSGYHFNTGIDFSRCRAYTKFSYTGLNVYSYYDIKGYQYNNELTYSFFSTFYSRNFRDSNNNVGLRFNLAWN